MNPYYKIIAGRFTCNGSFLSDHLKLLGKFELVLNARQSAIYSYVRFSRKWQIVLNRFDAGS